MQLTDFDASAVARYVEVLVNLDEVERALLVLDNLPAVYREPDNYPPVLKKLRNDILAAMVTPHAYLTSGLDANVLPEQAGAITMGTIRGRLFERELNAFNKLGITPHVVDVGPGEYHFPIAASQLGRSFTYVDVAMDQATQKAAHPVLDSHRIGPVHSQYASIFVAFEIIEHLPEPRDLVVEMHRHCGGDAARVLLSTPTYCFDVRVKDWRKPCGLPHLRAYTPSEFLATAQTLFPRYHWMMYTDKLINLRGVRYDLATPEVLADLLGG